MKKIPDGAEFVLVASLLEHPDKIPIVRLYLKPENFTSDKAGEMYNVLLGMAADGKVICRETFIAEAALNQYEVRPDEISRTDSRIDEIAEYIKGLDVRRQLKDTVSRGLDRIQSTGRPIADIVFEMSQSMNRLMAEIASSDLKLTSDGLEGIIDRVKQVQVSGKVPGLSTGFSSLDGILSGMHPGDFIVVAARPSMGKSALTQCMINEAMDKDAAPVLLFSPEMTYAEIVIRFLSMRSGINNKHIREGQITSAELGILQQCATEIEGWPLAVNDQGGIGMGKLVTVARRHRDMTPNLSAIYVDYLQLVRGDKSLSRNEEIEQMTGAFKQLAKDLEVPVVVLSQLSRDQVKDKTKRLPKLHDLRSSGGIEQDADKVVFIHRDKDKESQDPNASVDAWLLVEKNRNGPTGWIQMRYAQPTTRFSEIPTSMWMDPNGGR